MAAGAILGDKCQTPSVMKNEEIPLRFNCLAKKHKFITYNRI